MTRHEPGCSDGTSGLCRWFTWTAGGGDLATGLALVLRPAWIAGLLGVSVAPQALLFLRWIGVFVACVGAAYLYPWLWPEGPSRWGRLRVALEVTAGARVAVAGFVASAVVAAALSEPWLLVAGFDALVAIAQMFLLLLPGGYDVG